MVAAQSMISGDNITLKVVEALDECEISYLLAGSFSSNQYGVPRSTKDADFVLQLKSGVGERFALALGKPFELDPQLSFETITGTYRQIITCPGDPFKVELFLLSTDPHDQERFRRRRQVPLLGHKVWFPSAEDVIVTKLRWSRTRDKDDIRSVMAVQAATLDWKYIREWCTRHGTLSLMEEIRKTVPNVE
jgi:hypothetical protein